MKATTLSGGAPTPSNCDGAKIEKNGEVVPDVPCTYPAANGQGGVGELDVNLGGVVAARRDHQRTHSPSISMTPPPPTWRASPLTTACHRPRARADHGRHQRCQSAHRIEREPARHGSGTGAPGSHCRSSRAKSDPHEFNVRSQPRADASLSSAIPTSSSKREPPPPAYPVVGTGFAWNHGDIQPEIARTFIGIVGPGVKNLGVTKPTTSSPITWTCVRP